MQSGERRREALQTKERHITATPKPFSNHLKMVQEPKPSTVDDLLSFKEILRRIMLMLANSEAPKQSRTHCGRSRPCSRQEAKGGTKR